MINEIREEDEFPTIVISEEILLEVEDVVEIRLDKSTQQESFGLKYNSDQW